MFETSAPAKWVLAGEHSVLRGARAVALPFSEYHLRLRFEPGGDSLTVDPRDADAPIRALVRSLGAESLPGIQGKLRVESTIPVGAGLGSSAALSVAMTRWLAPRLGASEAEHFALARKMEDQFHGRSSGMDIAAVAAGEPVSFSLSEGARKIGVRTLPRFTFHDTGMRARTSECVRQVEAFAERQPEEARRLDESMDLAAQEAVHGLRAYSEGRLESGLAKIASAMSRAQDCFLSWGLVPEPARRRSERLLREGALAVKLTGAGGGGFLVALWPLASK